MCTYIPLHHASLTNIEVSRGKETPGLEFHYCDVKEVKSELLLCNHTLYEKKPFITVIVSLSTMPSASMRIRKYTRRRRVNMVWNFANILSVWASILALGWFNDDDGNGSVHPLAHSLFCHRVCVRSIPFLHIHPKLRVMRFWRVYEFMSRNFRSTISHFLALHDLNAI